MAKQVHIVPHMHWDREWYFTTEESRILLVNNMEEIMTMLEENPEYPYYVMDGQTAILEDYFAVRPENRDRVRNLVQRGKLIIGPWYTQTDEMVVGGESIVRNLFYGLKDSREFGKPMMIGYLPDSFGQSEKMPQILNSFGITRSIFWRGSSERHGTRKHNFHWKSNSEGEVLAHLMPLGYAIGKYLPVDESALKKRMDKYLPVLDDGAVNEEILLPNGHDQMPIQKNIFSIIKKLKNLYPEREFFLSRYEHLFEKLEQMTDLDTIQGELLDGKYMRVHRSIFSSRADLKARNTRIENKITNLLEPLAALAYNFGFSYEEGMLEAIWKELMKNHAHDSIGCCCSDKVHQAIANRFFLAEDKTDALIRYYQRKIVDAMSCEQSLDKLTAFNLLPYMRDEVVTAEVVTKMTNFTLRTSDGQVIPYELLGKEVVDAGLIDRQIVHYGDYAPFMRYRICFRAQVPALGFETCFVQEAHGDAEVTEHVNQGRTAQNDFYSVTVEENGTLTITDKCTGNCHTNVLMLEDGSDDGDEYDFSPLQNDFVCLSQQVKAQVERRHCKYGTSFRISYDMLVPADLESRKVKLCDTMLEVVMDVVLKQNSPVIEVKIEIENTARDHRVRVLVPQPMQAAFSIADNPFGQLRRPVQDAAMEHWVEEHWDERPDAIYPMLSYVGTDAVNGLSVLTNSVREYEVVGLKKDILAITLFRSVGYLGKENLVRRPGRPSGIRMATPDSQMLGRQSFELALVRQRNIARHAKEYTTPIISYNKMPYNAMKLNPSEIPVPYRGSLLRMKEEDFILSALKKSQGREGFILRGYQVEKEKMETACELSSGHHIFVETNLNEEIQKKLEQPDHLILPRNVVKTYWFV